MKNLIKIVDERARVVDDDPWGMADAGGRYCILSVEALKGLTDEAPAPAGVLLHPDDDPELLLPWLDAIELIALDFPSFRDGRAYTQAVLLRSRLGFKGDLRAVGDVLRDQLAAMRHCGFSSFAVRDDKAAADALKGLAGFDLIYAGSVLNPEPLFRRRQPVPSPVSETGAP